MTVGALNTINGLVGRLEAFVGPVLAETRLEPSDGTVARPPVLVTGWLPPKRSVGEPLPPLIVIRATGGQDDSDGGTIEVQLLLQTYAEDAEGWQDLGNLIQRLRNALTGSPTLGPFCLQLPLRWQIFDEQPEPQWEAMIFTTWTQPSCAHLVSPQLI